FELRDELGDRGLAAHPTPEPEPMSDAAREVEHIERSDVTQVLDLSVDRPVEVAEITLNLLGTEQVVRERAALHEELVGQLAHEHAVVGKTLARNPFLDRIERAEPNLAEGEKVGDTSGLHGEGVTELPARVGEPDDRIGL